jgi:hypothetical protein
VLSLPARFDSTRPISCLQRAGGATPWQRQQAAAAQASIGE